MEVFLYLVLFFIVVPFIYGLANYVLSCLALSLKRELLELEALEISNKERVKRLRD